MCVPRVLAPDEGESIWEGNTMHLTAPAVSRILIHITRHVKHFTVSFDYMAEEVIAKTTWRSGNNSVVERFAAMALLGITASVMSGALQTKPRDDLGKRQGGGPSSSLLAK